MNSSEALDLTPGDELHFKDNAGIDRYIRENMTLMIFKELRRSNVIVCTVFFYNKTNPGTYHVPIDLFKSITDEVDGYDIFMCN